MPSLNKTPVPNTFVSLDKKSKPVNLGKSDGDWYTLICVFDRKDYDLLVEVIYTDGTREWVSAFGTDDNARYSLRSRGGDVVHLGDRATSDRGGQQAFEVIQMRLGKNIAAILPVVYSAQNSGLGSFRMYGVSTYVLAGKYDRLPDDLNQANGIIVTARRASWNPFRFSFVPCVIRNGSDGSTLDPTQQRYSGMMSERRPRYNISTGTVKMNDGPRNRPKSRPGR
jgi:tellurite resistance protein TerA